MDKVEQIHLALRRLVDQRKRRKEEGRAASERDDEEEDRLLSCLLSQLDSLEDSSTSSFPTVELDQKREGREDDFEDLGADRIVKELRNVKRQNSITHGLLSVMIIITAIWQLSEMSILLSLKDKFRHPFKAAATMISGFLKGGGNLQEIGRLTATSKNHQVEANPIPPIGVPELLRLELPSLNLTGGEEYDYLFDLDEGDEGKVPCLCGAPSCQKFMNKYTVHQKFYSLSWRNSAP